MSDDDVDEPTEASGSTNPLGLTDRTMTIVGAAAVAVLVVLLVAERDVARRDVARLRGPRWLWHGLAATPPGVVLYGLLGIKGPPPPPMPNLNSPTVNKYAA